MLATACSAKNNLWTLVYSTSEDLSTKSNFSIFKFIRTVHYQEFNVRLNEDLKGQH